MRAQQQALNARQVKIQIQRELDLALNSGDRREIKIAQEYLRLATQSLYETIEASCFARQSLEHTRQLLDQAKKQLKIEAQLANHAPRENPDKVGQASLL